MFKGTSRGSEALQSYQNDFTIKVYYICYIKSPAFRNKKKFEKEIRVEASAYADKQIKAHTNMCITCSSMRDSEWVHGSQSHYFMYYSIQIVKPLLMRQSNMTIFTYKPNPQQGSWSLSLFWVYGR